MANLQAQWVVGFVDGEGCFHVGINKNQSMTLGYQVLPEFTIVQHKRNIKILYAFKDYFGCGVVRQNHGNRMCYRVRGHQNLLQKILPFFEQHQLKTTKQIDFLKFRRVVLMMDQNRHLSIEGLDQIRAIQNKMNTANLKIESTFHGNMKRSK
mmetsp:Transcript_30681/g.86759  ORF Transcript_30681/g.86759 Transcript_30681/m.86759 type:complete len:153 (-) Transcript_30681:9-467(-)